MSCFAQKTLSLITKEAITIFGLASRTSSGMKIETWLAFNTSWLRAYLAIWITTKQTRTSTLVIITQTTSTLRCRSTDSTTSYINVTSWALIIRTIQEISNFTWNTYWWIPTVKAAFQRIQTRNTVDSIKIESKRTRCTGWGRRALFASYKRNRAWYTVRATQI